MAHRQSNATHTFHDILEAAHLDLSTPSCYSEQLFLNFIFILLFFFFLPPTKLCLVYFHISTHPQHRSLSMLVVKLLTWIWMLLWSLCFSLLCLEGARSQWKKRKAMCKPTRRRPKGSDPFRNSFYSWKCASRWLLDASASGWSSVRTDPALLDPEMVFAILIFPLQEMKMPNSPWKISSKPSLAALQPAAPAHSMALIDQVDESWNALIK